MRIRSRSRLLIILLLVTLSLVACGRSKKAEENAKVYPLKGKIISRDSSAGTLTIAHEAIPGRMEAMTMPFPVRGMEISDLPPDGSMIEAKLHLAEMSYWITEVRESPVRKP